MSREMLINTVAGHECRIAVVENGVLEELYAEQVASASRVGNIYKGRVTNVEPAIQAAFVDFGAHKNGFLHISDLNPTYFPHGQKGGEAVGKKRAHYDRPPIQECLRRGQEVIVQMTKEGLGTKGPTMTTYLSIPGRLLVMMPGMSRLGVSRKVQDDETRAQARAILQDLVLPPDMGFILRTAGLDKPKREIQRDLNYLTRLWKSVTQRINTSKAPAEIYQESDLVIRTIRDVYNADIDRIICDSKSVALKVREFLSMAMPRTKHAIEMYTGKQGLYHEFGLESEIEKVFCRRVELKSGGWLAIDQAEALVAIDVNSGRFREHSDAETTALKINQEAAIEIARQLRLRDLGGVVIIDFIDMREERNRRAVEKTFRDAMKPDRAKTKVLKISQFGIVEMTRQRVRPSLRDSIYCRCTVCDGTGLIKSEESQALKVIRNIQRAIAIDDISQIEIAVSPMVAHSLANQHRNELAEMESAAGKRIIVRADATIRSDGATFTFTNNRGGPVALELQPVKINTQAVMTVNIEQLPDTEPAPVFEDIEGELPEDAAAPDEQTDQPQGKKDALTLYDHQTGDDEPETDTEIPAQTQPAQLSASSDAAPVQPSQSPRPQQARQDRPAQPAQQPQPVQNQGQPRQPGQPGLPGLPGQGKRRRRGRRGGQRHRKHDGQPMLPGQTGQALQPGQAVQPGQQPPTPQGQPAQPAQGQPPRQNQPAPQGQQPRQQQPPRPQQPRPPQQPRQQQPPRPQQGRPPQQPRPGQSPRPQQGDAQNQTGQPTAPYRPTEPMTPPVIKAAEPAPQSDTPIAKPQNRPETPLPAAPTPVIPIAPMQPTTAPATSAPAESTPTPKTRKPRAPRKPRKPAAAKTGATKTDDSPEPQSPPAAPAPAKQAKPPVIQAVKPPAETTATPGETPTAGSDGEAVKKRRRGHRGGKRHRRKPTDGASSTGPSDASGPAE